jgi:hypothetical protein
MDLSEYVANVFLLLAFGIGLLVWTMGRLEGGTLRELLLLDGFVYRNTMH